MREVARLCDRASALTGGAFSAQLPGPNHQTVFNPTGLVKGWAVQQAFDNLLADPALRDHDALINAGGDIAVQCRRTDTPDWTVATEDPRGRQRALRTLYLPSAAGAPHAATGAALASADPRPPRPGGRRDACGGGADMAED